MRLVLMGTSDFAIPVFTEIVENGHDVVAVYTRAPRRAGRNMELRETPVHRFAESRGLPVLTPDSFNSAQDREAFAGHEAEVAVVVAYGLILPQGILEMTRHGCLNLHASLLPRWRGAAPVHRAIMAGDRETGVTVMGMEKDLDSGPVYMVEKVPITADMVATELTTFLARRGADLMLCALGALSRDGLRGIPQAHEQATYARKIEKTETRMDWTLSAMELRNHIHGLSVYPGAWCEAMLNGRRERLKVLRAAVVSGSGVPGEVLDDALTVACGDGALRLLSVQRPGKMAVTTGEFLRGAVVPVGSCLM